ncbi:MAG: T9SS type A sorting domain-containing protein [Ignavibacteria bacterium]|nr:T9SS type A sorting domain-containing protein [Ignavibacteria bacterium]
MRDLRIIKYNSSGTLLWSSTFERPADYDQCTGICVDDSNNIYANVETYLPAYQKNIGIYKYDKNGNLRWNQYYTGLNNSTISSSITVDKYFNVYAGGWGSPTIGVLLKYSQGYNSITSYQHTNLNLPIPDPGNVSDTIYVSNDNPLFTLTDVNVTIDTVIHSNVSDLEFYLIHDGITDTLIYQVGGSGDNFIRTTLNDSASTSIAVGTAPFTGSFKPSKPLNIFNSGNHSGAWILNVYDRLSGNTGTLKAWSIQLVFLSPTGINTVNGNVPDQFSLSQNYPNPFNPATKIRFSIPNVASSLSLNNVTLKVYDLLGREVLTLVNEQLKPGTYEVDFDGSRFSSGVYFYKLTTDAFVQTKKMILVK